MLTPRRCRSRALRIEAWPSGRRAGRCRRAEPTSRRASTAVLLGLRSSAREPHQRLGEDAVGVGHRVVLATAAAGPRAGRPFFSRHGKASVSATRNSDSSDIAPGPRILEVGRSDGRLVRARAPRASWRRGRGRSPERSARRRARNGRAGRHGSSRANEADRPARARAIQSGRPRRSAARTSARDHQPVPVGQHLVVEAGPDAGSPPRQKRRPHHGQVAPRSREGLRRTGAG